MTAVAVGDPIISEVKVPASVEVFDLYEISFQMGSYDNPYDPEVIDVYAEFVSPTGVIYRAIGFYFEDYTLMNDKGIEVAARNGDNDCWKIRFTPDEVGRWTFTIHAVDQTGARTLTDLDGLKLAFDCQARAAEGFVRKANSSYLKREAFVDGQLQYHSFFPVGPNVAWYSSADYYRFKKPYGIYDYEHYIDSLSGNANYMRIWLNRYQYLSLYGPEHAIRDNGKPVMYFDSSLNQKDAAELDYIVRYAADHGIVLMPCFFSYGDFRDDSEALDKSEQYSSMPSGWRYNPYHTILKLDQPEEFFTDPEAMRITGNFFRYIVARWGYATNIMAWELWNEVCNIFKYTTLKGDEQDAVLQWHQTMAELIRSCDPHQHLITTSLGNTDKMRMLPLTVFEDLDVVQEHFYGNIQKAQSKGQMTCKLLENSRTMREQYPEKPNFMGEYGLNNPVSGIDYLSKDPQGIDMHNSMWASLFSGSMGPASFWYWQVLDKCGLYGRFKPLKVFCEGMPVLSDDFTPISTGYVEGSAMLFPYDIQLYYLVNTQQDTIMGWCQDVAFAYQSLRLLTDSVGLDQHFANEGVFDPNGYVYTLDPSTKPLAQFKDNMIRIPIANQPRRTRYLIRWFDSETGMELSTETTEAAVIYRLFRGRHLRFRFPESLKNGLDYTNTFGDAVFVITKISD